MEKNDEKLIIEIMELFDIKKNFRFPIFLSIFCFALMLLFSIVFKEILGTVQKSVSVLGFSTVNFFSNAKVIFIVLFCKV